MTRPSSRPESEAPDSGDEADLTVPFLTQVVEVPRVELRVDREADKPSSRVEVIDGEEHRIGSNGGNELVLDDRTVSRFHCCLRRTRNAWRITDNGSLNGTFVNGVRVRDADLPLPTCTLKLGDSIVTVSQLRSVAHMPVPPRTSFGALVGGSIPMRQMFGLLERVAKSESTVVIEGESGTGKELIATEIVRRSPRANGPLMIVDCGAIAPELIESELFGHLRGAFTSADRDRIGAFEAADGGTVFLDEIGELPLAMQPKLLRALEAHEIRRVGDNRSRKVDVRVIAATNRKLEVEVNQGRFREDLFFRLSVVSVRVPPLRERPEDIPMLIDAILATLHATDRKALFADTVLHDMKCYDWPGNVRELRNFIERSLVLDKVTHAPMSQRASSPGSSDQADIEVPFKVAKEHLISGFEQKYVTRLLQWSGGRIGTAARKAGVDRMYLYRLMQRYGLRKDGSPNE